MGPGLVLLSVLRLVWNNKGLGALGDADAGVAVHRCEQTQRLGLELDPRPALCLATETPGIELQ